MNIPEGEREPWEISFDKDMNQFENTFKTQISQQDKDVFMAITPHHLNFKYGLYDFMVLCSIFLLGFVFSWSMNAYRKD